MNIANTTMSNDTMIAVMMMVDVLAMTCTGMPLTPVFGLANMACHIELSGVRITSRNWHMRVTATLLAIAVPTRRLLERLAMSADNAISVIMESNGRSTHTALHV